jgi:proline dehydrogenase
LGSFGLFEKLHEVAKGEGFIIGMKLVHLHGKEHARAKQRVSNTFVHQRATDANYDATVDYMIDHLDGMAIFLVLIMKKVLII